MYNVKYGDIFDIDLGLHVKTRPNVPIPERNVEVTEDKILTTSLTRDYGTYKDIEINIEYNFISREDFEMKSIAIKRWIYNCKSKILILSDSTEYYRKVKKVTIETITRSKKYLGTFKLTFRCDPNIYALSGLNSITINSSKNIKNNYSISKPNYTINGEGMCTLTVNNNSVTVNVGQSIVINTEKELCFKNDGNMTNITTGKYKDLYLLEGDNTIKVSSGFTLYIVPNWRW